MQQAPLLPPEVREAWVRQAKLGHPPSFVDYVELELSLVFPWWHDEAIRPVLEAIKPDSPIKTLEAIEATRGGGKSTLSTAFRLWLAEWVIPYLSRSALPIRPENRHMVLFGRDERHIRDDILGPLARLIIERAPWLRTHQWETLVEDTENPTSDGLRALSELKSKGQQKWEALRLDLANGVSIRTRTLRQSVRGLHVFYADMDDPLMETNAHESAGILSLIQSAIFPALEPGGLFMLWGTAFIPGDLFDLVAQDPSWHYRRYPAIDPGLGTIYRSCSRLARQQVCPFCSKAKPYREMNVGTPEVDIDCLWPARLSMAALEQARGSTRESNIKFRREYLLDRVTDDTALVYPDDILAARDETLSYEHFADPKKTYYLGADPSGRLKDEAGFCGGHIVGQVRVVAHFSKLGVDKRLAPGEGELSVVDHLNELCIRFNSYDPMIEGNGAQRILLPLTRRMNPSIRPRAFLLGANKHTENGWLGTRTVFRSRLVRLPYKADEDKRLTDEFVLQLRGLQFINGEIVEDPKRRNDLVSAFFLFLKASEQAIAQYSVSSFSVPSHSQPTIGISLPSGATSRPGISPSSRGELARPQAPDRGSLQSVQDRLSKWSRRR